MPECSRSYCLQTIFGTLQMHPQVCENAQIDGRKRLNDRKSRQETADPYSDLFTCGSLQSCTMSFAIRFAKSRETSANSSPATGMLYVANRLDASLGGTKVSQSKLSAQALQAFPVVSCGRLTASSKSC
mmetsp:Transcript_1557/g.2798  ORF Transcript_1557/g.2798 Transcript_1557/m.2798 type:complete len:129 (+) Transcript_1557:1151-1537(+)